MRVLVAVAILAAFWSCEAAAQNNGGVFPPVVNEGSSLAEYRVGLRPRDGDDGLGQRVHYQRAVSDDVMWRIVGGFGGTTGDQDFQFVQGELFWDLSEDTDAWRTGLRFDGVVRDGGAPEQINVNWTNQFQLSDAWTARAILLNKVQIGDNAADGIAFETRANLFTQVSGITIGLESYNLHGSTEDMDIFGGRQQIGPYAVWPVADGWGLFTGVLFGANAASPDTDLRLWVTRTF